MWHVKNTNEIREFEANIREFAVNGATNINFK